MFLTLTPAMHQIDSRKHEPGPIDHITLNLAVESRSYHFVSGDKLGPLVNNIKAASLGHGAPVSEGDSTPTESNKVDSPGIDDKPTDIISASSVPHRIENPVLPPVQNDKQDTVADKQDEITQKLETIATTLPTRFLAPATVLKNRLENTKDLIVCPGVYDGFSARIALSVGFDALYMVSNTTWRRIPCLLTPPRQVRAPQPLASGSLTWALLSSVTCVFMQTWSPILTLMEHRWSQTWILATGVGVSIWCGMLLRC